MSTFGSVGVGMGLLLMGALAAGISAAGIFAVAVLVAVAFAIAPLLGGLPVAALTAGFAVDLPIVAEVAQTFGVAAGFAAGFAVDLLCGFAGAILATALRVALPTVALPLTSLSPLGSLPFADLPAAGRDLANFPLAAFAAVALVVGDLATDDFDLVVALLGLAVWAAFALVPRADTLEAVILLRALV